MDGFYKGMKNKQSWQEPAILIHRLILCLILKTIEKWKMIEHIKLILKMSKKEIILDMTLNAWTNEPSSLHCIMAECRLLQYLQSLR